MDSLPSNLPFDRGYTSQLDRSTSRPDLLEPGVEGHDRGALCGCASHEATHVNTPQKASEVLQDSILLYNDCTEEDTRWHDDAYHRGVPLVLHQSIEQEICTIGRRRRVDDGSTWTPSALTWWLTRQSSWTSSIRLHWKYVFGYLARYIIYYSMYRCRTAKHLS